MQLIMLKLTSEHLEITPLGQNCIKNPDKSGIMDHVLLEGQNALHNDFLILIPENSQLKSHLKESILIK